MAASATPLGTLSASPVPGAKRVGYFNVTFGANYATGGYALAAGLFGLTSVDAVLPMGVTLAGLPVAWKASTAKLLVFKAVGTEEDNAAAIGADTVQVLVVGS